MAATHYKLLSLDDNLKLTILQRLATAPNSRAERAYNALMLGIQKPFFEELAVLDMQLMKQLMPVAGEAITVLVNVSKIQDELIRLKCKRDIYEQDKARLPWLIQNQASNQMILMLCSSIKPEDIKQMRLALKMPVSKGRIKLPCHEVRTEIYADWQNIPDTDCFIKYQKLAALHPEYNLSQLYSVLNISGDV